MVQYRIERKRLSESVVSSIFQLIEDRQYQVGDKLPTISEMCRIFHLSTTTIREALCVLESMGMIDVRHGSGIYLLQSSYNAKKANESGFTTEEGRMLFQWVEFRKAIEGEIAFRAALNAQQEDIENITDIFHDLHQVDKISDTQSREAFAFHHAVAIATHNAVFEKLTQDWEQVFGPWIYLEMRARKQLPEERNELVTAEHKKILDAIAQHLPLEAKMAMCEHLDSKYSKLLETLK